MFQRDYILRMIEQMAEMIGTVTGLRKQLKQEQAFELVDELLGRFFRLNSKLLDTLSPKDILDMLSVNGFLEQEKILMLCKLMQEEGELHDSLNQTDEAYRRYMKALYLALAVLEQDDGDTRSMGMERIRELADKLKPYMLPVNLALPLFRYYVRIEEWAHAEDELFWLLNSDVQPSVRDSAVEEGIAFYLNLLEKKDDILERGGLPRIEAEESLAELRARHIHDQEENG
ncbi:DUF6483 family protein [Gorillibacterium massiliense]|uniref:DUF6483 family protein n=1 Tax=Gorillibacterium massiliense TaxID=1280390 RepID=UPI0004B971A8|nr:DUF6483 family protein [Gorillibacterium massiliense]